VKPSLLRNSILWHALYSLSVASLAAPITSCLPPSIILHFETAEACLEVVRDLHGLEQGLMFRTALPENTGMLFVFPQSDYYSMWMKDTPLNLSAAFLDEQGRIINIEEMRALSTDYHYPQRPARFVIEMQSRWFDLHHIQPGQQVLWGQ